MADADTSRLSELIWRGDNRSAIKALEGISSQSRETTETLKGDADEQTASFVKVREESSAVRDSMVGLMGMVGIGGVAFGMKDLAESGMELQSTQAQLRAALRETGQVAGDTFSRLSKYAEDLSSRGGFGSTENLQALTQFVRETKSAAEAQKLLALSTSIARARNISLSDAQEVVAKAYDGQARGLQSLLGPMVSSTAATVGLTTAHQQQIATLENEASMMGKMGQIWLRQQEVNDHLTAQQTELAALDNKRATARQVLAAATSAFAGSTSKYNKTAAGEFSDVKNSVEDLTSALGTALLPAMDDVAHVGADVARFMAKNKTEVLLLTLGVTGLAAAWGGLKILQGIKAMALDLAKAFGITGAAGETAGVDAAAGAEAATVGWDTFMTGTIVGIVLVGLVELVEHWHAVESAVVGVWHTVEGAVVTAWHTVETVVGKGVAWVWSKIKWLAEEAKKLLADTPIGGLIGFGSNLLSGHVGRAFGDVAQGFTGGIVNPNAGTVGLPFNNAFGGAGSIHIVPQSNITLRTSDREIGRATARWTLNAAARGPTTLVGGSLVTGAPGLPVGG